MNQPDKTVFTNKNGIQSLKSMSTHVDKFSKVVSIPDASIPGGELFPSFLVDAISVSKHISSLGMWGISSSSSSIVVVFVAAVAAAAFAVYQERAIDCNT